jgi:hypothetical protein
MIFYIGCAVVTVFCLAFLAFAMSPAVLDKGEEGYDDGV